MTLNHTPLIASRPRRTALALAIAGILTAAVAYYSGMLARLPEALRHEVLAVKLLSSHGSAAEPQIARKKELSPTPTAAIKPSTAAGAVKVDAITEHAVPKISQPTRETTPPALTTAKPADKEAAGAMLDLVQPPAPQAPEPLVPTIAIQKMPLAPEPAVEGPADHSIQVNNMPQVAQALDQLDKRLVGGPGLVAEVLVDSTGHAVQVVRAQSGGNDIEDAAIMEHLKTTILQMNPAVPPGQQRWAEFTFNYSGNAQAPPAASAAPLP